MQFITNMLDAWGRYARRKRMKIVKPFSSDLPAGTLRVTLCDLNPDVVQAWVESFQDVDAIEIVAGSLVATNCEALVSPANSFGDMGGGVDKRLDDFFEGAAQRSVQAAIRERFYGELPVGMALVVPMPSRACPFLIVAPTMRIPQAVTGSINAYLAMRAILVAILRHNETDARKIERVGVPGLGTGVGGIPATEAAQQMRVAYDNVLRDGWQKCSHPSWRPMRTGRRRSRHRKQAGFYSR